MREVEVEKDERRRGLQRIGPFLAQKGQGVAAVGNDREVDSRITRFDRLADEIDVSRIVLHEEHGFGCDRPHGHSFLREHSATSASERSESPTTSACSCRAR
jgi:hypothetical protein